MTRPTTPRARFAALKRAMKALRSDMEDHPVRCGCGRCEAYYTLAMEFREIERPGWRTIIPKEAL